MNYMSRGNMVLNINMMFYKVRFDNCLHGIHAGLRIRVLRNGWWSEIMGECLILETLEDRNTFRGGEVDGCRADL